MINDLTSFFFEGKKEKVLNFLAHLKATSLGFGSSLFRDGLFASPHWLFQDAGFKYQRPFLVYKWT